MSADDEDPREDRALVRSFLDGRAEGDFRALYRRHTRLLYPLALRVLRGDEGGAQDAVQETWIRAVERLKRFRWESTLRTWLAGILINRCREMLRPRGRAALPEPGEPSGESGTAPRLDEASRLDLDRGIARLPDGSREVFLLHDVQGHTHAEIARILGVEEGTSKSQLSRARRALRASLPGIGDRS